MPPQLLLLLTKPQMLPQTRTPLLKPTPRPDADAVTVMTEDSHEGHVVAPDTVVVATAPTMLPGVSPEIPMPGVRIAKGLAMQLITVIASTRILNPHPTFPTGAHLSKLLRRLRRNILKPDPALPTHLRHLLQIALLAICILLQRIMATAMQYAHAVAVPHAQTAIHGYTTRLVQST